MEINFYHAKELRKRKACDLPLMQCVWMQSVADFYQMASAPNLPLWVWRHKKENLQFEP